MKGLTGSYGRSLTAVFAAAVMVWAFALILLPQFTIFERALVAPKRSLDSSIAYTLRTDASTCMSVLKGYLDETTVPSNGKLMATPSIEGMQVPSLGGGLAVPAFGNASIGSRPYILQCDRATTHVRLTRADGEIQYLDEVYNLPLMKVDDSNPIEEQIAQAQLIHDVADTAYSRLLELEASQPKYNLDNFAALTSARSIPVSAVVQAAEEQKISNMLYTVFGLRHQDNGIQYERLGLTNLTRTIFFAMMVTLVSLLMCYPIAYKVALATPPEKLIWLMAGLIVPYAIVELMRIYAWTTIIDNNGLLNSMLMRIGAISEPIGFTRMPFTVFIVIAYTYVLFMAFPILNVMSTLDKNQIEAAKDLGASSIRVHRRIIIPHSKPGIAVGCIATFMLAAGAFSVPRIISRGLQAEWFAQTIYNKFFESENSNVGAAYSFAYTIVCFIIVAVFMWLMRTRLKDFARVQ